MQSSLQQRELHPVRALFQRRRRRVWVYVLWLLANIATAWFYAQFYRIENIQPSQWLLPILIPSVVVAVQIFYPTIFVWGVISIPTVFFVGGQIYNLILDFGRTEGPNVLQSFASELFFVSVSVGACVGLILFRPKLLEIVPPMKVHRSSAK
jgi:hypothetical protein